MKRNGENPREAFKVTLSPRRRGELSRDRRIVIIGAGPGGICAAIGLKTAGYENFVVLEAASGIGGTWFHNRYPGAACDVPSHLYSFSFEPKHDWTRPYAGREEIQAYLQHCIDKYGITESVRLNSPVRTARWENEQAVWRVVTPDDVLETEILVSAVGLMNEPSFPEIPGMNDFDGHIFHSARWRSHHDLTGERVATIGTGASAVQLIPEVAKRCGHLYVFQRSAPWVLPKAAEKFTPEQIREFRSGSDAANTLRAGIFQQLEAAMTFSDNEMLRQAEAAGLHNVAVVEDRTTRQALTPASTFGCLRPLISNDYYPTFNRTNTELVTEPIERITSRSVVTSDGVERGVDTIVLATGFQTTQYLASLDISGRDGRTLKDAWQHEPEAYLGISTSGFPNLFMIYGPNTNNGSILFMIECQAQFLVRQVQRMDAEDIAWMDVRRDAMRRYNDELQDDIRKVAVWQTNCSNYYRTPSGRIVTQWPHTMSEYRNRTAGDDLEAFEIFPTRRASHPSSVEMGTNGA